LFLTALANGATIIAKRIFGLRFSFPLDADTTFLDRQPLFGRSTTVRGMLVSLLITTAAAPLIGLDWSIGAIVAVAAMGGDLLSSFVKRRLRMPPSSQALGLDQVPESLFPFMACYHALSLSIADVALGIGIFFVAELIVSRLLFQAHLRDEPY
jgi:CDP-archaeol synthase